MSRIGKKPINLPAGVTATVKDGVIVIKGPKGELKQAIHPIVTAKVEGDQIVLDIANKENQKENALWGLFGALIKNMIEGVVNGYKKQLELNGVGYKVSMKGKNLLLALGFSHEVNFEIPAGIEATVEKNIITISGIDKQLVGEIAAKLRELKKPEPYKGKGLKYVEEVIRRKAGKTAAK